MKLRVESTIRVCLLSIAATVCLACSETSRSTSLKNPSPAVEALLLVSDLSAAPGTSITVFVKANAGMGKVASYTARIHYDAKALRFAGEALADKELRAFNPTQDLVRIAGVAPAGFADGLLAAYTFVVLQPNGARTLSLSVDEMHMVSHADARTDLTIAPARATSR